MDNATTDREISNLIEMKYKCLKDNNLKDQIVHENSFELNLHSSIKSCIFYSSGSMKINVESVLNFGGKSWKCIGAISNASESFFKIRNKWFISTENNEEIVLHGDVFIDNVAVAVYI